VVRGAAERLTVCVHRGPEEAEGPLALVDRQHGRLPESAEPDEDPGRVLAAEHAGWFSRPYHCIKAFSETLHRRRQEFDIPTLVIHGDDDQIVPIAVSGLRSAKMIKGATLKIYKGAPHGLMSTTKDQFNADLLQFAEQETGVAETTTRARRTETAPREISPSPA
jgi:pimeloyl-ACP methyl ester carboxylesterase